MRGGAFCGGVHAIALLLLLARWGHFARTVRRSHAALAPVMEWPVLLLGASYAGGLAAWLSGAVGCLGNNIALDWRRALAGIVILGAGAALRIAGISRLGGAFSWGRRPTGDALVVEGVYAVWRHPMVTGYVLEVLSLCILSRLDALAAISALAAVVSGIAQMRAEEAALSTRFGAVWQNYRKGSWP